MRTLRIDFNVDDTDASMRALLERLYGSEGSPQFAEDTRLDCTDCQYLGPMFVASIVAIRRDAELRGVRISLLPPTHPLLLAFCDHSGLLKEFGFEFRSTDFPASPTTPFEAFKGDLPLSALGGIARLVRSQMQLSEDAEQTLVTCLIELVQNVNDHAESPVGGVVAARAFNVDRTVRVAIADAGIGVAERLRRSGNYHVADDKDGLRQAIQEGVTSKSSSHNMGRGLPTLMEIVKNNGGTVNLFSRGGQLVLKNRRTKFGDISPPFPGTVALVRLKIPTPTAGTDGTTKQSIWE